MAAALDQQMPAASAGSGSKAPLAVLDGSTGYVLLQHGLPEDGLFRNIWSASALVKSEYHDSVVQVHKEYMRIGSEYITTNSYATQPTYYRLAFGDDFEARMLADAELSARLAVRAREEHLAESPKAAAVRVMGSLPPLVESHRPDIFKKAFAEKGGRFFVEHYKGLALALLRGGVDLLLLETMTNWEEAELALEALVELKKDGALRVPIIVSFEGSIRDEALKPQPHLAPALCEGVLRYKAEQGLPVEAIGWNCAPPEDILANLEALQAAGMLAELQQQGVRMAAYANLNERKAYDEGYSREEGDNGVAAPNITKREDLTASSGDDPFCGHTAFVRRFVHDYGISMVGGCCGCGPAGIEAICRCLQ